MNSEDPKSPYAGLAKMIRGGKSASTIEFENRPPELIIKRGYNRNAGHGIGGMIVSAYHDAIVASAFRVLIDDVEVGQLIENQRVRILVAPGTRPIRVVSSMVSRNEMWHQFANGDRVTLYCRPNLVGIILYK